MLYDSIYSYLLLLDWECLFSECSSVDDMLSVFLKVINDSLINNIGVKKVQHGKSKKKKYPKAISKLLAHKKALWHKLQKDQNSYIKTIRNS